jgi:hypothetical protein
MARLTKHHSISLAIFNGLDGRVSIEASCNQEGPAGRLPEVIEALLAADLTLGNAICKTGLNLHINQSINVTSVAMKFMENSCQPFTENHLFS